MAQGAGLDRQEQPPLSLIQVWQQRRHLLLQLPVRVHHIIIRLGYNSITLERLFLPER
jgi:hypothetical protein